VNLELLRFSSEENSTHGILSIVNDDGSKRFLSYTVEDPYRLKKIKHITRIGDGRYQIKFRAVGGFQSRYLKRYGKDFHGAGMLELQDVKGYSGEPYKFVLIHCGNSSKSSSGCIILGDSVENNQLKPDGWVSASRNNYLRTYPIIRDALLSGDEVWINIVDYDHKPKDQIKEEDRITKVGGGFYCKKCDSKYSII
tara:strand:- start:87 stop:674 length:588 start_codon:yes stop_codon:yes gene_type:complete